MSPGDYIESATIVGSKLSVCNLSHSQIGSDLKEPVKEPAKTSGIATSSRGSKVRKISTGENTAGNQVGTSGGTDSTGSGVSDGIVSDGMCNTENAENDTDTQQSEKLEITLDARGVSCTMKSLLIGRMMDEFCERPHWTIHLVGGEVEGMKYRTGDLALFDKELEHIKRVKEKHTLLYSHCTLSNESLERRRWDELLDAKMEDRELDDYARGYMSDDDELSQWQYYRIRTDAFGTELDVLYPVVHSLPFSGVKSEEELRGHMNRVYKSHLAWLRRLTKISHRRVSDLSKTYRLDRYLPAEMKELFHDAIGAPTLRMIMENLGITEDEFECKDMSVEKLECLYELFIDKIRNFEILESTSLDHVYTLERRKAFIDIEHIGMNNCYDLWYRAWCAIVALQSNIWHHTSEGRYWLDRFEKDYREAYGLPAATHDSSSTESAESLHKCDSETSEAYTSSGSEIDSMEKLELERKYGVRSGGKLGAFPYNESPGSSSDSCSDCDEEMECEEECEEDKKEEDIDESSNVGDSSHKESDSSGKDSGSTRSTSDNNSSQGSGSSKLSSTLGKSGKSWIHGDNKSNGKTSSEMEMEMEMDSSSSSSCVSFLGRKRGRARANARKKIIEGSDSE